MARRFNPPPGWVVPESNWQPSAGWRPDPSWPPAPAGWQFWVEDQAARGYTNAPMAPTGQSWPSRSPSGYSTPCDTQANPTDWSPYQSEQQSLPLAGIRSLAPEVQAAISASLVLPTLPAYFVSYGAEASFWLSWAVILLLELYFVVIVAFWSRSGVRRVVAATTAVLAVLLDRVPIAVYSVADESNWWVWGFRCSYASLVVFVASWGMARRQGIGWVSGLVPTAGLVVLALWFYEHHSGEPMSWVPIWVIDIGVLVLGCLLCWGCERLFRGGRAGANRSQ